MIRFSRRIISFARHVCPVNDVILPYSRQMVTKCRYYDNEITLNISVLIILVWYRSMLHINRTVVLPWLEALSFEVLVDVTAGFG